MSGLAIGDLGTCKTVGYHALVRLIANDTEHQCIVEAEEFIKVAGPAPSDPSRRRQPQSGVHLLHFINVSAGLLRHPDMMNAVTAAPRKHPVVDDIAERDFVDCKQALKTL